MSDDYSAEKREAIRVQVDGWQGEFQHSSEFGRLTEEQKRQVGAATEFFSHYAYCNLGVPPEEWDNQTVRVCCTEILPRKVSAEAPFFEALSPVLAAFFRFLGSESILPNGEVLAQTVAGVHDKIIAYSQDRSNWGMAKSFVMSAREAGVDIQDPKAMEAFIMHLNAQTAARRNMFAPAASRPQPFPASAVPATSKSAAAPASRYDPCPCGSGKKYKFCCEGR